MKRIQHRSFAIVIRAVLLGLILLFAQHPYSAQAAMVNYIVTRFDDPAPNGCAVDDCSLREAVIAANTHAGADKIYLRAGNYNLTLLSTSGKEETVVIPSDGDLDIRDDLTISGAGTDPNSGSVVYANPTGFGDRIFHVTPEGTRKINVTFINLVIKGGDTSSSHGGGGILFENAMGRLDHVYLLGNHAQVEGGGVTNYAGSALIITASTFDTNSSNDGGGIYNTGALDLKTSLLKGNTGSTTGGGLDNGANAIANVENTTISQNYTSALTGAAGISNSGTLTIKNVTIAENNGPGLRIESRSNTLILNSIFAQGSKLNCTKKTDNLSDIVSDGNNLVYGNAVYPVDQKGCAWNPTLDHVGTGDDANPLLGSLVPIPLGLDDGPTQYYTFTSDKSPALGKINNGSCPSTDQRLAGRGAVCDIGAYEVGGTLIHQFLPAGFH